MGTCATHVPSIVPQFNKERGEGELCCLGEWLEGGATCMGCLYLKGALVPKHVGGVWADSACTRVVGFWKKFIVNSGSYSPHPRLYYIYIYIYAYAHSPPHTLVRSFLVGCLNALPASKEPVYGLFRPNPLEWRGANGFKFKPACSTLVVNIIILLRKNGKNTCKEIMTQSVRQKNFGRNHSIF